MPTQSEKYNALNLGDVQSLSEDGQVAGAIQIENFSIDSTATIIGSLNTINFDLNNTTSNEITETLQITDNLNIVNKETYEFSADETKTGLSLQFPHKETGLRDIVVEIDDNSESVEVRVGTLF